MTNANENNMVPRGDGQVSGVKEALAALDDWNAVPVQVHHLHLAARSAATIRTALEAAAQEAEAWEAIEAWRAAAPHENRDTALTFTFKGSWNLTITREVYQCCFDRIFDSRLEALTKAAAWCRAKLAK